jgi:hypothetical protein
MTNHTPGPWSVDLVCNKIRAKDGEIDICRTFCDVSISEETANSHLISAAPDLLSALEGLAIWDSDDDKPCFCLMHGAARPGPQSHDSYCEAARYAIAKAKGDA